MCQDMIRNILGGGAAPVAKRAAPANAVSGTRDASAQVKTDATTAADTVAAPVLTPTKKKAASVPGLNL